MDLIALDVTLFVLAAALTLGLMTATPSMAQGTQPATKSDSKMAPAPKASAWASARLLGTSSPNTRPR